MSDHEPVTIICPECGALIEVKDVAQLIRTLHQLNECAPIATLVGGGKGLEL